MFSNPKLGYLRVWKIGNYLTKNIHVLLDFVNVHEPFQEYGMVPVLSPTSLTLLFEDNKIS